MNNMEWYFIWRRLYSQSHMREDYYDAWNGIRGIDSGYCIDRYLTKG